MSAKPFPDEPAPAVPDSVVLSTYFRTKPDPQRGITYEADDFELMRVWYESLHRVGLHGVIFHDHLSDEFIGRHSSTQVRFVRYELQTSRSVNDERFRCYLQWLEAHPGVRRLFMLDLFDVEFFADPFVIMDDERWDIYCGGDPGEYNNKYNRQRMLLAYGEPHYENEIKLNAGTVGGAREPVLRLLRAVTAELDRLTTAGNMNNLNMPVLNKCVYDNFEVSRIKYGYPLNSRFKMFETSGDFAIRHK